MLCISKTPYLGRTQHHPPFPWGCKLPILMLPMGLTAKARAPSPLKVITEIRMSSLETGCQILRIWDRVPTFQNFSIPGGGEINSEEPTMQVVHFKGSELQAIQLDSTHKSPSTHSLCNKVGCFHWEGVPVCYLPTLWKESNNHCGHREKSERHRTLDWEGTLGIK